MMKANAVEVVGVVIGHPEEFCILDTERQLQLRGFVETAQIDLKLACGEESFF